MKATWRVRVHGRVQGVWFRAWTQEQALDLGLAGWVRNRSDGTVEALLHGEQGALDSAVARLRRGPPLASVERIEVTEEETAPPEPGFRQLDTA